MKSVVYLIRLYFGTSYKKKALHVFLFSPFLSLSLLILNYLLVMLSSVNSSAIRISILLLVLLRQS